jgi:PGF-pre-PGF domain-containing protein
MVKKTLLYSLLTIVSIILLVPLAFAFTEDFQVVGPQEITVSDCVSSEAGIIKVVNTGNVPSGYSLTVSGSASRFVSLGPINFVLEPGQSQNILSYLTVPCGAEKEYDLNIHVSTVLDTKKVLSQKVFVEKVRNIGLLPVEYSKKIKPCGTASYIFNLTNTGSFDETYMVTFQEPLGKYVQVNFNQITLAAGQTVPLQIYSVLPCSIYGNYTIPFTVKAINTNTFAKTFVYLIVDHEYDYSLKIGNSYSYEKNISESLFVENNKDEIYSLCQDSRNIIPLKIKNSANLSNTYTIKLLNSPSWVKLAEGGLKLDKNEEKTVKIYTNTSKISGDFVLGINVLSSLGDISKTKNISLSVENCYGPEVINSKKPIVVNYNSTKSALSIVNKGTKTVNYSISIKGEDWLGVDPLTLKVDSGKTSKLYIVSNPTKTTNSGSYKAELQIRVTGTNIVYTAPIKIKLTGGSYLSSLFYSFILPYLWYLITALILLILLLVLLIILALKKKKGRKTAEAKKETVRKEAPKKLTVKQKQILGWLLLVLLFALLGTLLYLFWDKIPYVSSLFNQTTNQTTQKPVAEPQKSFFETLKEWFVPVKQFFADYWTYFAIGLAALVLLIALFYIFRWIKRRGLIQKIRRKILLRRLRRSKQKIEAAKTQKEPYKLRINKNWLWWIILILILLGLGYLVYSTWGAQIASFYENVTKNLNQTKANITQIKPIQPTVNLTSSNITKGPSLVSSAYTKIKEFITDYWIYFLFGIAGLILLLIIFLIIRKFRKRNMIYYEVDHADKEIILRNKKFACGEIIIKVKRLVYNISLWLKRTKKPTFIGAGDEVYEYFELTKENLDDSDVSEMIMRFRVKKSWLKRKNIKKGDVSLKRYHNKWVGLNTTLISEDKNYYYYESVLNQAVFGNFAIIGKRTEQKAKVSAVKETQKKEKFNFGLFKRILWWVILVLIFAGLILLAWYFWKNIFSFMKTYLWYILGAISILALVFLIILLVKLIKNLGQKAKKILKWILFAIIILLLLSLLGYGIYYVLSHMSFGFDTGQLVVQSNQSFDNATKEELPEEINQSLEEPQITEDNEKGIPNQEWNANTNITIDLSKYFSDPDYDKLYYTNTELQNINAFYTNNLVSLVPHKNWVGSEFVIFTADDMKGGRVDSNIVKLTVKAPAEPTFLFILSSYRPWTPGK